MFGVGGVIDCPIIGAIRHNDGKLTLYEDRPTAKLDGMKTFDEIVQNNYVVWFEIIRKFHGW